MSNFYHRKVQKARMKDVHILLSEVAEKRYVTLELTELNGISFVSEYLRR